MEEKYQRMTPAKIVITGPECTGKSELTMQLAQYFGGVYIEEYARNYILQLNRPYNFADIEKIAKRQVEELKEAETANPQFIFLDTYLVITKVWFEVVYGKCPQWIENQLLNSKIDLFLLCTPDLPWEKDAVRENGGEKRIWLFREYEKNLIKYNFAYRIVDGIGESRFEKAKSFVKECFAAPA